MSNDVLWGTQALPASCCGPFASNGYVRAGRLVRNAPRQIGRSARVLGCHVTVASIPAGAGSKCVCSHRCCSGVAWAVGVWRWRANSWRMGHGVASAWAPHPQQVLGMPVSGSCGNGSGRNVRAVDGSSIHKLPCALPGRRVTLRLLGANRRTAGTVFSTTYATCSGRRWWAWFLVWGLWGRGCL